MDLLCEIFFHKLFIIERELDKLFRFAARFPIGHIAWNRYRNHPMNMLLSLFDEDRACLTELNKKEGDTLMEGRIERKRQREETSSSTAVKRAREAEEDEFENALEYIID